MCTSAEECGIPGLYLLHEFVTEQEEQVPLEPLLHILPHAMLLGIAAVGHAAYEECFRALILMLVELRKYMHPCMQQPRSYMQCCVIVMLHA